jgi:type I restriction enzyme S subunit
MTGSVGQKRVPQSFLDNSELPLPPRDEQRRIVEKVEQLLGRVNAARERLARFPAFLKRFRQAVLAAACSGHLTTDWRDQNSTDDASLLLDKISNKRNDWLRERIVRGDREARRLKSKLVAHKDEARNEELPEGWRWTSLLRACGLVVDCHNKTAPYEAHGIPLVRTTNVRNGGLLLDEVKFVSTETYAYWSRRCPPRPGDVLFTREAPMGECAVIPPGVKLCMGQRMMLLRVFPEFLSAAFLSYAIQDPKFQRHLDVDAVGSGVKHLRVGDVEKLAIPLPPFPEQQEIVRRVEALFKLADAIEKRVAAAAIRADKLTQAILAKAFQGELVPTEAELAKRDGRSYETASALLARIRAASDAGLGNGAGSKLRKQRSR